MAQNRHPEEEGRRLEMEPATQCLTHTHMAVAAQGSSLFLTKPSFPITTTTTNLSLHPTNRRPLFVLSPPRAQFSCPKKNPKEEHQRLSFTISYLVESCGLSPDHANTVLNLLRDHCFSTSQISSLVKKRPVLLLANAESVLLPKLRFFLSIGVSKSLLARTLASDPTILTRSLVNQLIPSYNFLKSVLDADDKIVAALRRTTWIFLEDHTKNLVPNINHMSETGVPGKCIQLLPKP